jgi:hypothetical protein
VHRCRWLLRAALLAAAVVVAPAAASAPATGAARTTVTIALTRGYAKRPVTACGLRRGYRFYRLGGKVSLQGTVSPAPSGTFHIRVVVRRCSGREFTVVKEVRATGGGGRYRGSFPVSAVSNCYVQAVYSGSKSNRDYFAVR